MVDTDSAKKRETRTENVATTNAGPDAMAPLWRLWGGMPGFAPPDAIDIPRSGAISANFFQGAERLVVPGRERYQADASFPATLPRCRTSMDMLTLQTGWFEAAARDYREAVPDMVRAGTSALPGGIVGTGDSGRPRSRR